MNRVRRVIFSAIAIIAVLHLSGCGGSSKTVVPPEPDTVYTCVFESRLDGLDNEIYRNTITLSNPIAFSTPLNLTNNAGDDMYPFLSPDGNLIVFSSNRNDGNYEIYLMTKNGSASPERLTNDGAFPPLTHSDTYPSIADDGTIAWESDRFDMLHVGANPRAVWLMDTDGSNKRLMTEDPVWEGYDQKQCSISPDGQYVVFVSPRGGSGVGPDEIYTYNLRTDEIKRLTANSWSDFQPKFSPDSSKIAFVSWRNGNADIYIMRSDGTKAARLTNNNDSDKDPAWSPDGRYIIFASDRDREDKSQPGPWKLYIMDANTGASQRLLGPAYDGSSSRPNLK